MQCCLFRAYSKGFEKKVKTSIQLITTAANIFYVQYAQFATKEPPLKWNNTAPLKKKIAGRQLSNTITKRYHLSKTGFRTSHRNLFKICLARKRENK